MARRRAPAAPRPSAPLILPARLLVRGLSAAEHADMIRERDQVLREHHIDPHDWTALHPVLKASRAAHGLDLPPRRLIVKDEPARDDAGRAAREGVE